MIVLPVFGGATISMRCPSPIGATMSITRVKSSFDVVSRTTRSSGSITVRFWNVVLLGQEVVLRAAQAAVAAVVDVQHALDGLGRLVPRLLLRALLLSVTLRMLGSGLLRLRLRHAVRVLGHALGRRLPFRDRLRGRAFGLREFLGTGFLP